MPSTRQQLNRCWVLGNSLGRTMEDTKNTKDPKKDKDSPELKEELTDEELSGLSGGAERKFDDGERDCKFVSLAPKVI